MKIIVRMISSSMNWIVEKSSRRIGVGTYSQLLSYNGSVKEIEWIKMRREKGKSRLKRVIKTFETVSIFQHCLQYYSFDDARVYCPSIEHDLSFVYSVQWDFSRVWMTSKTIRSSVASIHCKWHHRVVCFWWAFYHCIFKVYTNNCIQNDLRMLLSTCRPLRLFFVIFFYIYFLFTNPSNEYHTNGDEEANIECKFILIS